MNIKLPWDLPKTITIDNQIYKFISCQLKPKIRGVFPATDYIEIHYKNKEWGYNLYFSRWTSSYRWKKLGIKYEDFLKYESKLIERGMWGVTGHLIIKESNAQTQTNNDLNNKNAHGFTDDQR